jgi:L-alanine-DL-glutamate epimerase-like enolase superfamily enzyme
VNTSYGDANPARTRVIVNLETDSGLVGRGEAAPLPSFTGETVSSIQLQLEEFFLPLVVGRSPFALTAILSDLDRLPANTTAKAAIDVALHDLQGQLLGRPVVDLLGGAVRDRVPVANVIGIEPVASAVAQAEAIVAAGHGTIKMKIGRDPAADIERVGAVRAAVGPGVKLRVDANAGYTVPVAVRLLGKLAAFDLEHAEQPVAGWDRAGLAEVRRATGLPIMADESLHTIRDAVELIERGAADVFAIKLIKTGGLAQARVIAALAAAHRIDIVVVSPYETEIGTAAGLALALAAPTATRAQELGSFYAEPGGLPIADGYLYASWAPGLGAEPALAVR